MIVAVVDDLMVGVRIEEAAKAIGTRAEAVSSYEEARRRLRSGVVGGLVVDLAISGLVLGKLVREARQARAWVMAFPLHRDRGVGRGAGRAGCGGGCPPRRCLRG